MPTQGLTVVLTSAAPPFSGSTVSGVGGVFSFAGLLPGSYLIYVDPVDKTPVTVVAGQDTGPVTVQGTC